MYATKNIVFKTRKDKKYSGTYTWGERKKERETERVNEREREREREKDREKERAMDTEGNK